MVCLNRRNNILDNRAYFVEAKIKDIATVRVGYSFRSRLDVSRDGNVAVIQMKDLLDDNTVGCDGVIRIDLDNVNERHLVCKGDLVFRLRGLSS